MEDMPIGSLGRLVEELESSDHSIAEHFGRCRRCGASIRPQQQTGWHDPTAGLCGECRRRLAEGSADE